MLGVWVSPSVQETTQSREKSVTGTVVRVSTDGALFSGSRKPLLSPTRHQRDS